MPRTRVAIYGEARCETASKSTAVGTMLKPLARLACDGEWSGRAHVARTYVTDQMQRENRSLGEAGYPLMIAGRRVCQSVVF